MRSEQRKKEEGDYQVLRKYKAKDIILRIVSLKVIIPDRSGWLFKFLKTAEECKLELRQVPPTAQLSSNVTKFSNHRVPSSAQVSRSPGGLFLVEIKQADRVSAKPAISILVSISSGV